MLGWVRIIPDIIGIMPEGVVPTTKVGAIRNVLAGIVNANNRAEFVAGIIRGALSNVSISNRPTM